MIMPFVGVATLVIKELLAVKQMKQEAVDLAVARAEKRASDADEQHKAALAITATIRRLELAQGLDDESEC